MGRWAEPTDRKADFATRLYRGDSAVAEEMMEVFHAIIIDNLSYQEAAGKFGIPTGTIRSPPVPGQITLESPDVLEGFTPLSLPSEVIPEEYSSGNLFSHRDTHVKTADGSTKKQL